MYTVHAVSMITLFSAYVSLKNKSFPSLSSPSHLGWVIWCPSPLESQIKCSPIQQES